MSAYLVEIGKYECIANERSVLIQVLRGDSNKQTYPGQERPFVASAIFYLPRPAMVSSSLNLKPT